ncbi:consortin isoform 2-T2 [Discoglossus pictus]
MNTEQAPLEDQQTSAEGGLIVCDDGATENTILSLKSDVNENKVDGEKNEMFITSDEVMVQGRDTQDSLNNNENCNLMCGQLSCKTGCEDHDPPMVDLATPSSRDIAAAKGKRISGRRSNKNKKNCNGKSTGFPTAGDMVVSQESKSAHDLSTPEANSSHEPRNHRQLRESLFFLIREEFEQTEDVRMLPTCLHQIAETYFQEEDYENAMQFIQLERIYHEQLLANLSAIQEQWETKWKTTGSTHLPSFQTSEKGLSSKELERLSNLCGSHQDPKISTHTLSASEKSLKIQSLSWLMGSVGAPDVGEPSSSPDRERRAGSRSRQDRKAGVAAMTENSPPDLREADDLKEAAVPRQGHSKELHSTGATSEAHTQSTGTVSRANPVGFSTGDAVKNNNLLQPEATPLCNDVSGIEVSSKDLGDGHPGKPIEDKLISGGTAQVDSRSEALDDTSDSRSSLDCHMPSAQVANNATEHCKGLGEKDFKESPLRKPNSINIERAQKEESLQQKSSQDAERVAQRQATVEFLASLLNGGLTDSENFLAHLDFQEEAFSEEEMSPSPGDNVLGDNLLSLDELAKRIEIEECPEVGRGTATANNEVNPASGLVSILKKRNGNDSEKLAPTPQKQTKRKVRFQEMDDALDQEEIGGGSCILLVALCLVTVFLSIGGTAVYCTFADVESSVCKDFAENMDFYYTQLLQGMEELKHWLFVT